MTPFTLSLARGDRIYEARYVLTEGAVRVESAFGSASGPARSDPHATAESLMHRIVDVFERSPQD